MSLVDLLESLIIQVPPLDNQLFYTSKVEPEVVFLKAVQKIKKKKKDLISLMRSTYEKTHLYNNSIFYLTEITSRFLI